MLRQIFRSLVLHPILEKHMGILSSKKKVRAGPFKGMTYIDRSVGSAYFPKLAGTYEKEWMPELENLINGNAFNSFIILGAAEGYFAVGVTWRTKLPVIAFEPHGDEAILELARANHVEPIVEISGTAHFQNLKDALARYDNALIICDIEGSECILLDPQALPDLTRTTICVEVHDCFLPGTGKLLISRFETTHQILRINATRRTRNDVTFPCPTLPFCDTRAHAATFLDEERPPGMYWLIMCPNPSANS